MDRVLLVLFWTCWIKGVLCRPGAEASPLSPLAEMLTNTNGKSPLVAATYYFNPASASHPLRSESVALSPGADLDSANGIESAGPAGEPGACTAPDGRKGSCYEANECVKRGGMPMGTCGDSGLTGKTSGVVCCLFEITCGDIASEKYVYFRNPGYPLPYRNQRMCRTRVVKKDKSICQYRVDLQTFDIAPPNSGNCSQDIFVVSGQNENHIVPKICGFNNGHHYYFGVDESGIISFHMMMLGAYERKFDILITQIPCRSDQRAPSHCLQYYTGTHGQIKSFNYDQRDLVNASHGYPNDIDYIMCVRKEAGFCSVTYELATTAGQGVLPFAIGGSPSTSSALASPTAVTAKTGRQPQQQQQQSLQHHQPIISFCKDDYLVIGGLRLCSASLYSGHDGQIHITDASSGGGYYQKQSEIGTLLNASYAFPALITDVTPGPFIVRFVSNQVHTARGFNLNYRQNPCK